MPAVNEITPTVATPAGLFEDTFARTDKVSEVIAAVVAAMNLNDGGAFELASNGESLAPERVLGGPMPSLQAMDCNPGLRTCRKDSR